MSICDNCIHDAVCGLEDCHEEAMTFCSDMISKDKYKPKGEPQKQEGRGMREIIIKIPDTAYEGILNADKAGGKWGEDLLGILCNAITHGTPLPKGHGRLVDAEEFEEIADMEFEYIISPLLNHIQTYDVYSLLEATPTIIEADKPESER